MVREKALERPFEHFQVVCADGDHREQCEQEYDGWEKRKEKVKCDGIGSRDNVVVLLHGLIPHETDNIIDGHPRKARQ